jgi:hypothetical protein
MPAQVIVKAVNRNSVACRTHSRVVGRAAVRGKASARATKVGMLWIDSDLKVKP